MIMADFLNPGNPLGGQSDVAREIVACQHPATFAAEEN